MAVNVKDIRSKTWSIKVSALGEIVADIEDLKQSIVLILTTVKGTVPLKPDFGCGLYDYIDQPVNLAAPLMVREIRNALSRFETRLTVTNISYRIEVSSIFFSLSVETSITSDIDGQSSFFVGLELDTASGLFYLIDQFGRRITTQFGPIIIRK